MIFIAYRVYDMEGRGKPLRIAEALECFGPVFFDTWASSRITPGEDFVDALKREVLSAGLVLVLIGPKWLDSFSTHGRPDNPDYLIFEIATALSADGFVIPLLFDGAELPRQDQLPAEISGLAQLTPINMQGSAGRKSFELLPLLTQHLLAQRSRLMAEPEMTKARNTLSARTRSVFVSYRRADSQPIARLLLDPLRKEFGEQNVFVDMHGIPPGADFHLFLREQVLKAGIVLVLIADRWSEARDDNGKRRLDDPNDFVRIEIETAIANNIPLIPIYVDGVKPLSGSELPTALSALTRKQGIKIETGRNFESSMGSMMEALCSIPGMNRAAS